MIFVKRASIFTLLLLALGSVLLVAGFIWSGAYNIAADDEHTRPVYTVLQTMRSRSIAARARAIHPPPELNDRAMIKQGAGNYAAMCSGCHLAPGMAETELSQGLYPAPPALAKVPAGEPSHQFWVIKHGIKASGMPAWGRSMDDKYIWAMVAFLQQLPELSPARYQALVATSGGHSHGGTEDTSHEVSRTQPTSASTTPAKTAEHRHADGTVESHPVPEAPHEDAHEH
jgi:mono/diheme cytochrome c family protein